VLASCALVDCNGSWVPVLVMPLQDTKMHDVNSSKPTSTNGRRNQVQHDLRLNYVGSEICHLADCRSTHNRTDLLAFTFVLSSPTD
jgi:hypothetical protein